MERFCRRCLNTATMFHAYRRCCLRPAVARTWAVNMSKASLNFCGSNSRFPRLTVYPFRSRSITAITDLSYTISRAHWNGRELNPFGVPRILLGFLWRTTGSDRGPTSTTGSIASNEVLVGMYLRYNDNLSWQSMALSRGLLR